MQLSDKTFHKYVKYLPNLLPHHPNQGLVALNGTETYLDVKGKTLTEDKVLF